MARFIVAANCIRFCRVVDFESHCAREFIFTLQGELGTIN